MPQSDLYEADLYNIPLDEDSIDVVVCALALSHIADLERALRELVRVLRPDGHLVVSDSRGLFADISLPLVQTRPDGSFGYMPIWSRLASDYLAAALPLGLEVRRCDEVRQHQPIVGDDGTDTDDGSPTSERPENPSNIWALHPTCPAATNAAWLGKPRAIIWHFQLASR